MTIGMWERFVSAMVLVERLLFAVVSAVLCLRCLCRALFTVLVPCSVYGANRSRRHAPFVILRPEGPKDLQLVAAVRYMLYRGVTGSFFATRPTVKVNGVSIIDA